MLSHVVKLTKWDIIVFEINWYHMMSKKTECCGLNFKMSGKMFVEEIIDFVQTVLINLYWKIVSFWAK